MATEETPISDINPGFDITLSDKLIVESDTEGTLLVELQDLPPIITISDNVLITDLTIFPATVTTVQGALVDVDTRINSLSSVIDDLQSQINALSGRVTALE